MNTRNHTKRLYFPKHLNEAGNTMDYRHRITQCCEEAQLTSLLMQGVTDLYRKLQENPPSLLKHHLTQTQRVLGRLVSGKDLPPEIDSADEHALSQWHALAQRYNLLLRTLHNHLSLKVYKKTRGSRSSPRSLPVKYCLKKQNYSHFPQTCSLNQPIDATQNANPALTARTRASSFTTLTHPHFPR